MSSDHTNLLPEDRARALKHLYFFRLATVAVLIFAAVAIVHGVLLLPSYLLVRAQVDERTQELSVLTQTLASTEEKEISARVTALASTSAYLARHGKSPKVSTAVAALIQVPREGVRLRGFSYAPNAQGAQMTVSGVAATRESLRRYEQALSSLSYIKTVELPISAYAKESNIDFVITLTGTFTP